MPALVDAVIARLGAQVSALGTRVEGAAQFADLMRLNALPQVTPAAFVLPIGLQGGRADVSAGLFRQETSETIGVLLTLRTHSRTGGRHLDDLDMLIAAVTAAVAGWGPDDEIGVFRLARGQLVNMAAGTLVYQLDFTITDQLRIPT